MFNFIKTNKYKKYLSIAKKICAIDLSSKSEEDIINLINSHNDDSFLDLIAMIVNIINRTYKINVYDEQIAGALALYDGNLIDMKTGEGKTIVAILTSILLFKNGRKTTIFTANDYLVDRDYQYSLKILNKLNISVGRITDDMDTPMRRSNYESDIVYSTVKSSATDYIGDRIEKSIESRLFKNIDFAIIDEVDFVLIDESTIPISISRKTHQTNRELRIISNNIDYFEPNIDFTIDKKTNDVKINESGFRKLEELFINNEENKNRSDLYTSENIDYINAIYTSINANHILKKDVDYVVQDDKVIIVGKTNGRLMYGRRWNGGLHLAVELKENLEMKDEVSTIAETNIYYFISKFKNISGMSGTTMSEKIEFKSIYGLDVVEIPTVKKSRRIDLNDVYSLSKKDSMYKILKHIKDSKFIENEKPILIGTVSVMDSELIYDYLKDNGLENIKLINARNHLEEAEIMSKAGLAGSITIATSMSGRGTDIVLGSKDGEKKHSHVNELVDGFGGLQIIGFQRNRMRRLDEQLIGRSGRQGDNGSSVFFVSAEDDLMAGFESIFKKMFTISKNLLAKKVLENQDEYATSRLNSRKSLVKFSNPLNKQNDIYYSTRDKIIEKDDLSKLIKTSFEKYVESINKAEIEKKNIENVKNNKQIKSYVNELIKDYNEKTHSIDFIETERRIALHILDDMWPLHLQALENSRVNSLNSTYKQADPVLAYEKEAIALNIDFWDKFFIGFGRFLTNVNPNDFIEEHSNDEEIDFVEFKSKKLVFYINKIPM